MIPWIVAGIAILLAVFLFIRLAALMTESNRFRTDLVDAKREAKKLGDKLSSEQAKYSKVAQEASEKGSKGKNSKKRLVKIQQEMQQLKTTSKASEERVAELAGDLKRVRIEREKLRQEIAAARERLKQLGETAAQVEQLKAEVQKEKLVPQEVREAQAANPDDSRVTAQQASRLERDLEKAGESVSRLEGAVKRLKTRVIERESELRRVSQKNEHNRRAYIITQLQLDLVNDELYFLKHGKRPDYEQAAKAEKRRALLPESEQEAQVEILDRAPIQLPGNPDLPEPTPEPEPVVEAAAPEPEASPEPAVEAAIEATPEPAEEAAPAEAKPAKKDVVVKPPKSANEKTTVLRKKATPAEADADAADDAGPARPKAPPRPAR